jgi:succinate dehydrogenase/fumarate reductase flavoprotein subunit
MDGQQIKKRIVVIGGGGAGAASESRYFNGLIGFTLIVG